MMCLPFQACDASGVAASAAGEDPVMVATAAGPETEEEAGRERVDVRLKTYLVQNPVDVDRLRQMVSRDEGTTPVRSLQLVVRRKTVVLGA